MLKQMGSGVLIRSICYTYFIIIFASVCYVDVLFDVIARAGLSNHLVMLI